MDSVKAEERAAAEAKQKDQAFMRWLDAPMTRFGYGLASKGDADAMRLLLRSAFDAGHLSGGGQVAAGLLEAVVRGMEKGRKGGPHG